MKAKITFLSLLSCSIASMAQNRHAGTNAPQNTNEIVTINSTIAYQGYDETEAFTGQGEYEIFADNVDGVLDKPIILVDGFDPTNSRSISMIYDLLNYGTGQNLATDLRNQGYDVVILNFPNYTRTGTSTEILGGSDYIQRNAMILVELINTINSMKVGTEQNVVIGPSLGGLIARYALRYMEMNSLTHDTRLFLSFDAPHKGANIPIGFQHLFNYMAYGPLGDTTVQALVDAMLKSPASREILIDQFEGHLQSGSAVDFDPAVVLPTGKPNFRNAFQSELDAMGFPQNTRNVAIANGSSAGTMNGTPGMVVMDHTFNVTDTERAIINLHFTPSADQEIQVSHFQGQVKVFGIWITVYESSANSKAPADSDGLDSAPGGKFDISSLAGLTGTNPMLTEFFDNLLIDSFDFVPTQSALSVSPIQDWYDPITDAMSTPFAATQVPSTNENHVTLTDANVAFALNEILNPLSTGEQVFSGLQIKNPVADAVVIYSGNLLENVEISISDLSGKMIYHGSRGEVQGELSIPFSAQNGMYLLTLRTKQGGITKKLIKK